MSYARLNIPLSDIELQALRAAAQKDLRHPKDQARYLLRRALLGDPPPDPPRQAKKKNGAQVYETTGAALPATSL